MDIKKYISDLSLSLSHKEMELKRVDGYLRTKHVADVSISNIEYDALSFVAKNPNNKKANERILDCENIRKMSEKYSLLHVMNENLIRECDKNRNVIMKMADEISELNRQIELLNKTL